MNSFTTLKISSKTWNLKKRTALSKRDTFLATYRQQQEWSFPDSLIYYITKNPSSPKCYKKIIQSCKHFFIKNPILVVQQLSLIYENNEWEAQFNGRNVDLKKILSKIWIESTMHIWNHNGLYALARLNCKLRKSHHNPSPIFSKIYRCDIKTLFLRQQNIFLDDLKFLASTCKNISFTDVIVMNENGSVIQTEDILQAFPTCKYFLYEFEKISDRASKIVTSKTAAKLLQIPNFFNLIYFSLSGITEAFDIDTFYDQHIKKNKNTNITLCFNNQISDHYQTRLQAIVDEIVADENREYKIPFFIFRDITESSHDKMWEIVERQ